MGWQSSLTCGRESAHGSNAEYNHGHGAPDARHARLRLLGLVLGAAMPPDGLAWVAVSCVSVGGGATLPALAPTVSIETRRSCCTRDRAERTMERSKPCASILSSSTGRSIQPSTCRVVPAWCSMLARARTRWLASAARRIYLMRHHRGWLGERGSSKTACMHWQWLTRSRLTPTTSRRSASHRHLPCTQAAPRVREGHRPS